MRTTEEAIKQFKHICWYPSAGKDFRPLLFISNWYYKKNNVPIDDGQEFPDLFILTDHCGLFDSHGDTSCLGDAYYQLKEGFCEPNAQLVDIEYKNSSKVIDSFRGENYFLSNFYHCDFEYEGLTYHTAEAAFQAQKCSSVEEKIKYTEVKNPVAAKRMGRKEPNLPENWNDISYDIMKKILKAKFTVPEMKEKLHATGNAKLVEENKHHDNIWGKCYCESCLNKHILGLNRLGNILMEVRESL